MTVVILRRARPGEGQQLLGAAARLFAARFAADPSFRAARILQQLDDPDAFLFAGDWLSREAYWQGADRFPSHAEIEALSEGRPERLFFCRVAVAEDASQRAEVVRAVLLEVPDASGEVEIARRRALLPRLWQQPGFVFQHLLRGLDDPRRLLCVYGWTGAEAMAEGHRAIHAWLGNHPRLEITRLVFQGRARLRFSRVAGPPARLPGKGVA